MEALISGDILTQCMAGAGGCGASSDMYVVAWTGGYDQPSFFSSRSKAEALAKLREWESDCKSGDRVDLLRIGLDGKNEVVLSDGNFDDNDSGDDN